MLDKFLADTEAVWLMCFVAFGLGLVIAVWTAQLSENLIMVAATVLTVLAIGIPFLHPGPPATAFTAASVPLTFTFGLLCSLTLWFQKEPPVTGACCA